MARAQLANVRIADRFQERNRFNVATELNVGHLMLLLQFGNMGKDLAKYNTKLFAEQVMPKLQLLFSEWEDRWWPERLRAKRPAAAVAANALT